MTSGIKTVIYPVKDLARAKKLYATLSGVDPSADEAYYGDQRRRWGRAYRIDDRSR
jgi:hypothetical protein